MELIRNDPASMDLVGSSETFLAFRDELARVARVDRPIIIVGERGTGKELAAARLHYLSQRWQARFVTLNCAALAPSLQEAELFGHEPGAFTGAAGRRRGRFEVADRGTLFLDELANMPMTLQEKILRVVEYGVFERLGSSEPTAVDVRVIAATNVDLPAMAAAGRFKRDLLDRLCFEVLTLPPLRERGEDVQLIATHFAARMASELGRDELPEFSPDAVDRLAEYSWPGNVRELKNVVERAVSRSPNGTIQAADLVFDPFESPYRPKVEEGGHTSVAGHHAKTHSVENTTSEPIAAPQKDSDPDPLDTLPLKERIAEVERTALRGALAESRYNQRRAAELLGLTYDQFRGLYRKHQSSLSEDGND
ncbi:phage shock protein operon transcriptional activator [Oceanidesulfovibrio marinus]|uniref:Phage shock protein operon transcriptional activator n=1 Tax=Oceanidesulfovibrio marinus TaxID=370038 RepID=A0A6P1ZJU3_9BACT|nr:phage shock protein operon transcriptional activator [Oceanidesulfovibrio marinus]TVM35836.1 phage shock protein operon transcriptional activator [Oceanidesulfovibrio marinus]